MTSAVFLRVPSRNCPDVTNLVEWTLIKCNHQFSQERFQRAMQMVGAELLDRVNYYKTAWLPARDIVLKAVNARKEVSSRLLGYSHVYTEFTFTPLAVRNS